MPCYYNVHVSKNRGKFSRFPDHHWVASSMIYAFYPTTFFQLGVYVAGAKLSTRQPASVKAANRRSLVVLDTECNKNICQVNPVILMKTLKVHSIWLKSPLRTTKRRHYSIRPFSSYLKPLFGSEASCKTIDMEMIFICK